MRVIECQRLSRHVAHPIQLGGSRRLAIGTSLFRVIERIAEEVDVTSLILDSSLCAVPFWEMPGFRAIEQRTHRLGEGTVIPCVAMRRDRGNE